MFLFFFCCRSSCYLPSAPLLSIYASSCLPVILKCVVWEWPYIVHGDMTACATVTECICDHSFLCFSRSLSLPPFLSLSPSRPHSLSYQRQAKYSENKLKSIKARNEYLLTLEATNSSIFKYYIHDLSDLIDVSKPHDLFLVGRNVKLKNRHSFICTVKLGKFGCQGQIRKCVTKQRLYSLFSR